MTFKELIETKQSLETERGIFLTDRQFAVLLEMSPNKDKKRRLRSAATSFYQLRARKSKPDARQEISPRLARRAAVIARMSGVDIEKELKRLSK